MSSQNIYIKPTRLLIKQHKITKLKYFCKSTREDYIDYLGSGVEWRNHLKQFGNFVDTLWVSDVFTDKIALKEFAVNFSLDNNIVDSCDWANKIIETGIGGGGKSGTKQYFDPIQNKYKLLFESEVKPHHIKQKNNVLSESMKLTSSNSKFYISPNGEQIRSTENLEHLGYTNKRINFGKNGNYFSANIRMLNLYTNQTEFLNKNDIKKYYVIPNCSYLFCINTPEGLKMSYSESILKSYLGTKGLKSLIDKNLITIKTKNLWLKNNFLGKNVSDIGFKYYPISEVNEKLLNNLINEGYEWVLL